MKRLFVPTASAVLSCLLAAPALAQRSGEDVPLDLEQAQESSAGGGGGSLVRTIVGLAIVIGVIYGLHWVLKQIKAGREEKATGQGLASLATLPLGPNRAVHVVRAGHEVLVLGATEHGIAQLRVYDEEEAIEAGLLPDPAEEVVEVEPARPRVALPALMRGPAGEQTSLLDTLRAWTVRR
jgi:flagellar protein FliO/FliZ